MDDPLPFKLLDDGRFLLGEQEFWLVEKHRASLRERLRMFRQVQRAATTAPKRLTRIHMRLLAFWINAKPNCQACTYGSRTLVLVRDPVE